MSRVYDDLETALDEIIDNLQEDYMRKIHKRQIEMLEPFKEFLEHKFSTQEKNCGKDSNGIVNKIKSHQVIIKELFSPEDEINISTTPFMREISQRLCGAFFKELREPKKSTCDHLSSIGGELSWDKATKVDIENSKKIAVANDRCESTFGVLTDEIKRHQNIGLTYARGVSMSRKNDDFASGLKKLGKYSKFNFQHLLLVSNIC